MTGGGRVLADDVMPRQEEAAWKLPALSFLLLEQPSAPPRAKGRQLRFCLAVDPVWPWVSHRPSLGFPE